ncbi:hypothetical protein ACIHJG_35990 [Streptomyces sp. NPDC052415]|uniref:hypothetical protein n=1 Tax=Streptomyces sp. NPDC052415 TaxID=3365690 RepID=UPI0037D95203
MKSPFPSPQTERTSRLIVAVAIGILVFCLVFLFASLVAEVDGRDGSSRSCPGVVGTVDPASTGTNPAGSSSNPVRKPAEHPKAPAAKAPAAPKARPRRPVSPWARDDGQATGEFFAEDIPEKSLTVDNLVHGQRQQTT